MKTAREKKKKLGRIFAFLLVLAFGLCMVYPLIWMFFAAFKTNKEIYTGTGRSEERRVGKECTG